MKQVALRLTDDMFDAIEVARGTVPRETWIKTTLAEALGWGPAYERGNTTPATRDDKPKT